ncbi:MAG: tetratricopeptide repeat protein [Candidatus Eremiobacteraeota bacterium]|nr:tetratricopeptide repeat protein [Candidatus Eremiobacteraeota bacterium]
MVIQRKWAHWCLAVMLLGLLAGCGMFDPAAQAKKHMKLARESIASGSYDKAAEEFNEVLKYSPDNPGALQGLIECYEKKGDLEKAIEAQKSSMEKSPSPGQAQKLASLYIAKNDARNALDVLMKELAISPADAEINRLIGEAQLCDKKQDEALRYFLACLLYDSTCDFDFEKAKNEQPYFFFFKYFPVPYGDFKSKDMARAVMDKANKIIASLGSAKAPEGKDKLPLDLFADKMVTPGEKIGSIKLGTPFETVKNDFGEGMALAVTKEMLYTHKKYRILAFVDEKGAISQLSCQDRRFITEKRIMAEASSPGEVIAEYGSSYSLYPAPPQEKATFKMVYEKEGIGFSFTGIAVSDIFIRQSFPSATAASPGEETK